MNWVLIGQLIGGLGLFLLGMEMMTKGLKRAAGKSLKTVLQRATQSRLRGLITGTGITAIVQSSSAVTVATLGFVNAGLMTLGQSIAIIYGSNIGTTLTAWLVALIGFKLKIGAFMLPLVGIGMALNLFGGEKRIAHYGLAIAGFGLFFVGLDFLKNAFDGLSDTVILADFGTGIVALLLFTLGAVVLTFLTQSSSAIMAIALSLVSVGSIDLSAAAAIVIGANIGTTTTALLAAIGATSNAKRIAGAHVIFNLQTGIVGILFLALIAGQLDHIDLEVWDPVILLALFHTIFNVVGVALIWPMTDRLERFLSKRFRTYEEIAGKPAYLDDTLLVSPNLAVDGINHELGRASQQASELALAALSSEAGSAQFVKQSQAVNSLVDAIIEFNQKLARQDISPEVSDTLPVSIRVARYIAEIARVASLIPSYQRLSEEIRDPELKGSILEFRQMIAQLVTVCSVNEHQDTQAIDGHRLMRELKQRYLDLKDLTLRHTISGSLTREESVELLDLLGVLNRLANQVEDVSTHWSSTLPIQHRSPMNESA